jgi:type IV secretion system protein VirD4
MNRMQIAFVTALLLIGAIAAAYAAGCAYFLISKVMPEHIEIDTWLRYWDAYSSDPIQRKRLLTAAAVSALAVLVAPAIAIAALSKNGRSLHGDARWATHAEIRRAGLL